MQMSRKETFQAGENYRRLRFRRSGDYLARWTIRFDERNFPRGWISYAPTLSFRRTGQVYLTRKVAPFFYEWNSLLRGYTQGALWQSQKNENFPENWINNILLLGFFQNLL